MLLNPYRFINPIQGSSLLAVAYNNTSPDRARFYSPSVSLSTYTNITTNPITNNSGAGVFSADGSLFACGNGGAAEKLLIYQTHGSADATTWTKLPALAVQPLASLSNSSSIQFSPDGQWLAVGHNASPFIEVYNTITWTKQPAPATSPSGTVSALSFSPDSNMLAVNGVFLRMYNPSTMGLVVGAPELNSLGWVRFSADGANLIIGKNSAPFIQRYETTGWTSQPIDANTRASQRGVASGDGKWFVTQASTGVDVWNAETWSKVPISSLQFASISGAIDMSFSKDSKYFAISGSTTTDNLSIVDTSDWSLVYSSTDIKHGVGFCKFSPF